MTRAIPVLFLWVCSLAAADFSGTWKLDVVLDGGREGHPSFVLKQKGEKLTGTYEGPLGKFDVTGTVKGNEIEIGFQFTQNDRAVDAVYRGTLEGTGKFAGTVEFKSADGGSGGKFTGVRAN